jgi:hypothetical protein
MFDAVFALWPLLVLVVAVAALRFYADLQGPGKGGKRLEVVARSEFFTASELAFHKTLAGAVSGKPVAVYPKVRALDLVKPKSGENYQTTLNKLRGQHVDWLLVSLPSFKPLIAIELDGASHGSGRQRNADGNKDAALNQAKLPVLRVSTRAMPDVTRLRELLAPHLPPDVAIAPVIVELPKPSPVPTD